jgi:hypothetical protein
MKEFELLYHIIPRKEKELVKVYAWKTENMTVEYEAKVFIRKGWMKFVPRFIYDAFASPDAEFSGSTPFYKWVNEDYFITHEFEMNNAVLDSLFDEHGINFRFEFIDPPFKTKHSEYFEVWPDSVIELN